MHRLLLAALLAAPLLSVAGASPAEAVTTVDASATDVTVRYTGCDTATVEVQGDWTADVYNEIQVVVRSPAGRQVDSETFYDDYTGYVSTQTKLCADDRPGTYRVEVVAIGYDESYVETSRIEGAASFEYTYVPKARARFPHQLRYYPGRAFKYVVIGRLMRAGHGYRDARVILAARIDGDWYRIRASRTNGRGFVGWEFKPNNLRWCYYFPGDRRTEPAVTDVFRTPNRGRAIARPAPATVAQARSVVVSHP